MLPSKQSWIKTLHVAKSQCRLSDDEYRLILLGAAGVESAKNIENWAQYNNVLAAFKKIGFIVKKPVKKVTEDGKRNREWITSKQEYYIRGLWDLASKKKSEESLQKMIKRIGGVDDIRFLPKTNATKVILALRVISEKAGFNPDKKVE